MESSTTIMCTLSCLLVGAFGQDPTDINRGCYFDHAYRALTDLITCDDGRLSGQCHASCGMQHKYCQSESSMTIGFCRTLCRNRNLKYYALQAGNQCFCGGALSDPFQYGAADSSGMLNCSYPCSGNASQTCGGEYKLQIYEFRDPVENSDCFHPGFVDNSYISDVKDIVSGGRINYICLPGYRVSGDAELTCQLNQGWSPNMLPFCNYTGIIEDPTTAVVTTTEVTTTPQSTTAALPLFEEYMPYFIGGAAGLLFLILLCGIICICLCRRRRRSGGAGKDIRLKPEPAPVTYLNRGYDKEEPEAAVTMPDILSTTDNAFSPTKENKMFENRTSSFLEDPVYQNTQPTVEILATVYDTDEKDPLTPTDENPPSPIYANAEPVLAENGNGEYNRQYTRNSYATTDRPNPTRGSSSDDPIAVYATSNRRAKKNATGTKDLVGWSRPSSLYQRTSLDDEDSESNEDNRSIDPNELMQAVNNIDKTFDGSSADNSFFNTDPAKTSATRL